MTTNAGNITNLQNQTFKLQANNDTASSVKASDTVKSIDGKNVGFGGGGWGVRFFGFLFFFLAITRSGNDITVATKDNVKSFTMSPLVG